MQLRQFTIRDLLLSTALIAAGFGAPLLSLHFGGNRPVDVGWTGMLVFAGFFATPLLFGAGLSLVIKHDRRSDFVRRPTWFEWIQIAIAVAGIALVIYVMFFSPSIGL